MNRPPAYVQAMRYVHSNEDAKAKALSSLGSAPQAGKVLPFQARAFRLRYCPSRAGGQALYCPFAPFDNDRLISTFEDCPGSTISPRPLVGHAWKMAPKSVLNIGG